MLVAPHVLPLFTSQLLYSIIEDNASKFLYSLSFNPCFCFESGYLLAGQLNGPLRMGPGRWLTASARRGQRLAALHAIPRRWAEEWRGLTPWGLRRSDACGRGTGAGAAGAGNRGPDRTEDTPPGRCTDSSAPPLGTSSQGCNFLTSAKCGLHAKCLIFG